MSLNIDNLKGLVNDTVLCYAPTMAEGLGMYQTTVYNSAFAPAQTIQVVKLGEGSADVDPANYLNNSTDTGAVSISMKHLQAKRSLTFAQIQQNIKPEMLVKGLMSDLSNAIWAQVKASITATTGATATEASTLADVWKALKGQNKCVVFGQSYLTQLQTTHTDFKMLPNNTMETGFQGFTLARYNDTTAEANNAFAWSQDGVVLALGEMIKFDDEKETLVEVGAGLPKMYSRITVDEATRKVTVSLECMAGVYTESGFVGKFAIS